MELAVIVLLAAALAAIVALSFWRPYGALRVLIVLLPLHSGAVLLLTNVLGVDGLPLTLSSAWKEAVIAGAAIAAVTVPGAWRRWRLPHWLALTLLSLIVARTAFDLLTTRASELAVLLGARQLGEFLVLLLVIAILRPSVEWFAGTARLVVPVIVLCAMIAIAQPTLGAPFYDEFFHAPGEKLHHSYLVNIGEMRRFRAVGTFIAPNEFGLGLVVYGFAYVLPLLAIVRRWQLIAGVAMLMVLALLLSFSRSAWIGAFVGAVATAVLIRGPLLRLWRRGVLVRIPLRDLLIGLGTAAGAVVVVFLLIGGLTLLAGTVSGTESSAAGRGESIGGGIEATFDNPGGLGLGTAGPRALDVTGSSVLTENWFLLYSIQLGVVALAIVAALMGASLVGLASGARRYLQRLSEAPEADWLRARYRAFVQAGAFAALTAAAIGALVIPALLDLTASLALWAAVAVALSWIATDPEAAGSGATP